MRIEIPKFLRRCIVFTPCVGHASRLVRAAARPGGAVIRLGVRLALLKWFAMIGPCCERERDDGKGCEGK